MLDRRQHGPESLEKCNKLESHQLLVHHERLLPAHDHVELVAEDWAQLPSQKERRRSSSPATPPGCNRPQIASWRLKQHQRAALSLLRSTRIYCGRLLRYGSSSSASTLGVGRDKGPPVLSPSLIAMVCLIFKVVSTKTTSFSEMLVTRNLPLRTSPRRALMMFLLFRSCTRAISSTRFVGLMIPMYV